MANSICNLKRIASHGLDNGFKKFNKNHSDMSLINDEFQNSRDASNRQELTFDPQVTVLRSLIQSTKINFFIYLDRE